MQPCELHCSLAWCLLRGLQPSNSWAACSPAPARLCTGGRQAAGHPCRITSMEVISTSSSIDRRRSASGAAGGGRHRECKAAPHPPSTKMILAWARLSCAAVVCACRLATPSCLTSSGILMSCRSQAQGKLFARGRVCSNASTHLRRDVSLQLRRDWGGGLQAALTLSACSLPSAPQCCTRAHLYILLHSNLQRYDVQLSLQERIQRPVAQNMRTFAGAGEVPSMVAFLLLVQPIVLGVKCKCRVKYLEGPVNSILSTIVEHATS